MDANKLSFIGHATHRFLSPVDEAMLDRALALAEPKPGQLAFDLGCGPAAMALHVAERWGLTVKAVDSSPLMIAEAERRIAGRGAPGRVELGRVELVRATSVEFLASAGQADILIAIGALALTQGSQEAAEVLKALAEHVKPGGHLLWGESYWKKPPSDAMRYLLGPTVSVYRPHHEYVQAGEAAGLLPIYAVTSSDQAWDEYTWRYVTAIENHVRDHPDDPDAEALKNRASGWRALYLAEGRDTMGFGLYLFRKRG